MGRVKTRSSHQCEECGKSFGQSGTLKTHIRTKHRGEKSYECEECGKSFGQAVHLKRHIRTVHRGETPYECEECGKSFGEVGTLNKHIRTVHRGEKPYECEECGKSFGQSGALKTHIRTKHRGEKSYECEECGKSFGQAVHLKRHIRTVHRGEKSYECQECGKSFGQDGVLNRHIKQHEEAQHYRFVCQMQEYHTEEYKGSGIPCEKRFRTQAALDYHFEAFHSGQYNKPYQTEEQLASFFRKQGIAFSRDRENQVSFEACDMQGLAGESKRAYLDFFLPEWSAKLGCIVIVGNDEHQHRGNATQCEFSRILKLTTAISSVDGNQSVSILYIRFNPHSYRVGGVLHNPKLDDRHTEILNVLAAVERGELCLLREPGMNLVYMYYDVDVDGKLCVMERREHDLRSSTHPRRYIAIASLP